MSNPASLSRSSSSSYSSYSYSYSSNIIKKVQFVVDFDARNTSHVYEAYATDILWTTPKELELVKRHAMDSGCNLAEEGYDDLFKDTSSFDTTARQHSLNDFVKLTDGRGIERFISRTHYEERRKGRKQAIKAVLQAQQKAKIQGLSQDEAAEQVREAYLQCSSSAAAFARSMGKADEACCCRSKQAQQQRKSTLTKSLVSQQTRKLQTHNLPRNIVVAMRA